MASHLTADRQKSHMGQEQLTLDLKIQPEPKQLTLDLQIRPEPSLENFAPGDNAELVSVLTSIKREGKGPYFLYLWGVTGSGRTHLLHAVDPLAGFERVPAFSPERTVYTVDDADRLSEDDQQKLFDLMCDIRSHVREGERPGYFLITSGSVPPAQMRGRPDVISRLSAIQNLLRIHQVILDVRQLSIYSVGDIRHHEEFVQLQITMSDIGVVYANQIGSFDFDITISENIFLIGHIPGIDFIVRMGGTLHLID